MVSTSNQADLSNFPFSTSVNHWNIFLSFRGPDTRNNFTSDLHKALTKAHIRTFIDDFGLQKGDEISSTLLKAIKNSDISIVIFSKNYVSSKWCLNELVEICKCRRKKNHFVLPIFLDVDQSDVLDQTGSIEKDLEKYSTRSDVRDKVKKWKDALFKIGNLSGYHLQEKDSISRKWRETILIKRIVKNAYDKVQDIFNKSFSAQLTARDLQVPLLRFEAWKLSRIHERGETNRYIAEIIRPLDIVIVEGTYEMQKLRAGLKYKLQVMVMLKDYLIFDPPLTLKLTLPYGDTEKRKQNLMKMERNKWIWLQVGEFRAQNVAGDIEFCLEAVNNHGFENNLTGLVIGSVRFLPTT